MKIILLKDLEKLGNEGDVVEVKDGYGRNFLIPNKLALSASKANLKKADELKKEREKNLEKKRQDSAQLKGKIESLSLTISTEAKEDEKLYGSINETQVLKLLEQEGVSLTKDKINIENPIDKLGVYKIPVKVSPDLEASLRLWVVKK